MRIIQTIEINWSSFGQIVVLQLRTIEIFLGTRCVLEIRRRRPQRSHRLIDRRRAACGLRDFVALAGSVACGVIRFDRAKAASDFERTGPIAIQCAVGKRGRVPAKAACNQILASHIIALSLGRFGGVPAESVSPECGVRSTFHLCHFRARCCLAPFRP